jgi:hypothetical protein
MRPTGITPTWPNTIEYDSVAVNVSVTLWVAYDEEDESPLSFITMNDALTAFRRLLRMSTAQVG